MAFLIYTVNTMRCFKYIFLIIGLFIRYDCNAKNQENSIKQQLKLHSQEELNANAKLSHEILEVVNELRTKSPNFKKYLIDLKEKFTNNPGDFGKNSYKENKGDNISISTNEGLDAINEAINFFDKMTPIPPLNYNLILDKSSLLMVKYMSKFNFFAHEKNTISEYSEPSKRIDQYCKKKRGYAENLWRGSLSDNTSLHDIAVKIVVGLFVDDGVKNRGHRENLINSKMTDIGNGIWNYGDGPYKGQSTFAMNFGVGIEK